LIQQCWPGENADGEGGMISWKAAGWQPQKRWIAFAIPWTAPVVAPSFAPTLAPGPPAYCCEVHAAASTVCLQYAPEHPCASQPQKALEQGAQGCLPPGRDRQQQQFLLEL
jgi:hypothetical protein